MYHTTLKNNYYNQSEYPRVYVGNIEDGNYHDLSISWDVSTKTLKVMFDGIVISTIQKDMVSEIFGVGEVYFGYTAGTGNYWNYQYVKDINVSGTLEGDQSGNVIYEWQYSADSASTWVDITAADSLEFTGINNDTLFLPDVSKTFEGFAFRAMVRNPAFACDPGIFTQPAMISILPDNDKDGITDDIDVDDDNDGILDTKELSLIHI